MGLKTQQWKWLKFIEYAILKLWDSKRYLAEPIKSKYEVVFLESHIQQEKHTFKPKNKPEKDFKILGVNNQEGLFDAYIEKGKNIKQTYQQVEGNWLAYNPYRVNVGSIGLKTDKHKYEWISNAYVVFSCKNGLLPEFLYKAFRTSKFNRQIRDFTAGSVRQNLSFDILSEMQIPLPSLPIQEKLVNEYEQKIKEAQKAEAKANDLEKEIEAYLLDTLGIEIEKPEEKQKDSPYKWLQFVALKDVSRWDYEFFINRPKLTSKYDLIQYGSFFLNLKNGISSRNYSNQGVRYLRVSDIKNNEIIDKDVKYVSKYKQTDVINYETLLITRKGTVGECLIFREKEVFVASSEIFIVKANWNMINPDYFAFVNNSSIIKRQIEEKRTGTIMPSLSQKKLKELEIPLPPLSIQNEIVAHIQSQKGEIKRLRALVEDLRTSAKADFEGEIFAAS